jgi:glucose/mannose-6-phosphate isomerase
VLCASYSGGTEETLSCYEAAGALGARRVVVTAGGRLAEAARADGVPVVGIPAGLQPRAAVAYMLVSTLEVAAFAGAGPRLRDEVDAAATALGALVEEWGPGTDDGNLAKEVAERMNGACPCIYGAGLTAAVAYRWKTQLNENAKLPAFAAVLPEADHNEIVGWEGAADTGRFVAVFLADEDQHPRTRRRIELTSELISSSGGAVVTVSSRGTAALERLLSVVLLGDLTSVYLAVLRELDPKPVAVIDRLKAALAD